MSAYITQALPLSSGGGCIKSGEIVSSVRARWRNAETRYFVPYFSQTFSTKRLEPILKSRAKSSLNGAFVEHEETNIRSVVETLAFHFREDFTGEVATLAFPALVTQAIEPLALLMETAFIGRIGAVELAAVGVALSAFNYVSKCFNIPLLNVTASFVAEDEASKLSAVGDEEIESVKQVLPAVSSSLVLGCGIGLIEAVLLGLGGGGLLSLMGITADSVMKIPAGQYLSLRALASPAVVTSLALQGVFRGLKDTKTPLYATVIASLSNIILAPILMFKLHYGVGGAATAFIVSQYLQMLYLLWTLSKRVILLPPRLRDLKLDRFVKSGGLLLGRTLSILSIMTFATSMAARHGALSMAAHQVCMQLWLAASLLSDSLAIAVQTLIAGAFAKCDYERARRMAFRVLQMGVALGLVMATALGIFSAPLSRIFTSDAGVLKVMATIMPFVALTQPVNSMAFILDGIHYGASDFAYAAYSMMVSAAVSSAVLFVAPSLWGLPGVWLGLTSVMSLRASTGLSRLLFATGPWNREHQDRQQQQQEAVCS